MATEQNKQFISLVAAADLSAKQYHLIGMDGNLVGNGEQVTGTIQNKPTSGQTVKVQVGGVTKAYAAEAIAVDANVASDANGQCVNAATGDAIFGVCKIAGTAAGDIISVLITQAGESA